MFFSSVPGACEVDGGTPALGVVARCYDSKRQHGHLFTEVRAPSKIFDYNNTCLSFYIQSFREEKGSFEMIRYHTFLLGEKKQKKPRPKGLRSVALYARSLNAEVVDAADTFLIYIR